jgi:outer membrane biosynthesis protein TonB
LALMLLISGIVYLSYERSAAVAHEMSNQARIASQISYQNENVAHRTQEFHVGFGSNSVAPAPVAWLKVLLLGVVGCVLAIAVFRRLAMPAAACGRRRVWPVMLAVPLLVIFLWGSVRYETSSNVAQVYDGGTVPMRQMTTPATPAQSAALANGFARMEAEAHEQIAHADIHVLMDKTDQPRIQISSQAVPPVPPAVIAGPAIPATPVAVQSPDKSEEIWPVDSKDKTHETAKKSPSKSPSTAAKTNNGSKSKNKKSAKPPVNAAAKPNEVVAQSAAPTSDDAKKKEVERAKSDPLVDATPASTNKTRPTWIDQPPRRARDNPREVIATDEYESVDECYQAADIYLMLKTYQRIQQLAGRPYTDGTLPNLEFRSGGVITGNGLVLSYGPSFPGWADPRLRALSDMGVNIKYIREKIVAADPKDKNEPCEYIETVDRTLGPMKKLYMQIEFSSAVDRDLRAAWDNYQRSQRFWMFGAGATSVLGLLGFVFGLLKLDTWTKGYYTKRLFIGVPAAIIGGLLLMGLFVGKNF